MNMKTYRLALVGFGNVGRGLAQLLIDKKKQLALDPEIEVKVTAVSDMHLGFASDPSGLNLRELQRLPVEKGAPQTPIIVVWLVSGTPITKSRAMPGCISACRTPEKISEMLSARRAAMPFAGSRKLSSTASKITATPAVNAQKQTRQS